MKLYRFLTSKDDNDERDKNFEKLPKEIQKKWIDILDEVRWLDVDYYGELFHKYKGDLETSMCICHDSYLKHIFKLKEIADEGLDAYFKIEDISEEVLYSKHDTSVYGDKKDIVQRFLDDYIIDNIKKDHILDKINLYGLESLTENDKRILRDEPYLSNIEL